MPRKALKNMILFVFLLHFLSRYIQDNKQGYIYLLSFLFSHPPTTGSVRPPTEGVHRAKMSEMMKSPGGKTVYHFSERSLYCVSKK